VEQPSTASSGVARGLNVVHVLPADWSTAPAALASAFERINSDVPATQLLVVVATADAAMAVAEAIIAARGNTGPRVVAATGAGRVARVLRAGAAPVVVGAPAELLALLRSSALKLDQVNTLAVGWVEEILEGGGAEDLEAVLADVPREAARVVITARIDDAVEDFIDRHARRAPRIQQTPEPSGQMAGPDSTGSAASAVPEGTMDAPVGYVLVARSARPVALRQVLDELDPPSAAIWVRSDEGEREARGTLSALGYGSSDGQISVERGPLSEHRALVIVYDLPRNAAEWRAATGGRPARIVAILEPRLLQQLRSLTEVAIAPLAFTAPLDVARAHAARLRAELRRELATGAPPQELLTLEPLLTEFDGVALAAASLHLLEQERRARSRLEQQRATILPQPTTPEVVRPAAPRSSMKDDRPSRGPGGPPGPRRDHPPRGQAGADRSREGHRPDRPNPGRGPHTDRGRPNARPRPRNPR
jgi:ATP-dependent RNA helicase DeaD